MKKDKAREHAAEVIGRISFNLSLRVLGIPKIYNELSDDQRADVIDAQRNLNHIVRDLRAKEAA